MIVNEVVFFDTCIAMGMGGGGVSGVAALWDRVQGAARWVVKWIL